MMIHFHKYRHINIKLNELCSYSGSVITIYITYTRWYDLLPLIKLLN